MAMRMVPIGQLFQRTARQVRDLSRKVGKQVEFGDARRGYRTGQDDRGRLADPVMHMVRNSIDHGIETPDDREAAGKVSAGQDYAGGLSPGRPDSSRGCG